MKEKLVFLMYFLIGIATSIVCVLLIGWVTGLLWLGYMIVFTFGVLAFLWGDQVSGWLGNKLVRKEPKGRHHK